MVTADVVGLYPSIPRNAALKALKDALDCRQTKMILTDVLVKVTGFVLTNNYFEFGQKVFHQISGTGIGTKFAPPYVNISMDKFEIDLLKTQKLLSLLWFRYTNYVFFRWTNGKEELESFMKELNVIVITYSLR